MEEIVYKKNQVIFTQGTYERCMYDIRFGTVGIYVNYGTKEQRELTRLGQDAFFGEMGMIEAYPRSATAVALEKGTICQRIDVDSFGEYFKTRPAKVMSIMQHMSRRIRELSAEVEQLRREKQ